MKNNKRERRPASSVANQRVSMKYAKLAHPRLFDACPRPRLFARIEALRGSHSVLWIASPPGAGKTTLVASYLSAANGPSIWYQVDEGDADPASFFFFLAQTARQTGPALPWLAPELADDVPRFARLFFREYFARLPERAIVVFDNVQEFDWERFGHLLEIAFTEVPEGITVVAISRGPLPSRLARLELSGRVATLDWNDLRFDAQEAGLLAQLESSSDPASLAWLDKLDGWAGGIVMLREHIRQGASDPNLAQLLPVGQEAVFRYFAGEILERMPPAWQRLLLLLSCLPGITSADAQHLTGDPSAARLLGQLFQHRLFVDRRGPAPFTYHFHALFREFLQYEADRRLDAGERAALLERAAAILDAQGRIEEAARLYRDAGGWPQLAGLLLASASKMLATGRGQTWREWLGWLPPAIVDGEARLRYWEGASLNQIDPVRAREALTRAELGFMAEGDVVHRLLSIAAIIDSYFFEWSDFHQVPAWIERMTEALRGLDPETLGSQEDLQIHSRLALALCLTNPDSALLASSVSRALRAFPHVESPAQRLAAGAFLMMYLNWADIVAARDLAMTLAPLVDDSAIAPFHRIFWCRWAIYRYQFDGNIALAQETTAKAQKLITDFGLEQMQFQLHFRNAMNLLATRDLEKALELIEHMRRMLSQARKLELVYVRILESSYFAQTGAISNALQAAQDAVQIGMEAKLTATTRWQITMLLAYCHAVDGSHDTAREWSSRAIDAAYGPEKDSAREEADFLSAYLGLANGREREALDVLARLLREQRERRASFSMLLRLVPQIAETLLPLALREGIETEHVRRMIVECSFSPRDPINPNWPWPIALRAFGGMELSFRGEPSNSGGKAQKRPLMVLKALLASGQGRKPHAALAEQLWPEVDDPKASLNVTIHRLRKLLGDDKSVAVVAGDVVLSEARTWSDVRALGELCAQIDALDAPGTDTGLVRRLSALLLELYRGPFCADDEAPWLHAPRESWRRRFLAAVARLGDLLEQAREWTAAHHLYARALEAEPLAEANHRGMMRCAHAQHDPAAAFGAYRKCREILSIVLARVPSAETEALAVELGLKQQ
jgi:LuxR family transcriptional regulator, maltose regulon positive regulatory protein